MREVGPESPDMHYERVLGPQIADMRNFADGLSEGDPQLERLKRDLTDLLAGIEAKGKELSEAA